MSIPPFSIHLANRTVQLGRWPPPPRPPSRSAYLPSLDPSFFTASAPPWLPSPRPPLQLRRPSSYSPPDPPSASPPLPRTVPPHRCMETSASGRPNPSPARAREASASASSTATSKPPERRRQRPARHRVSWLQRCHLVRKPQFVISERWRIQFTHGALEIEMNSLGGGSLIREEAEELGKRFEMQLHVEEATGMQVMMEHFIPMEPKEEEERERILMHECERVRKQADEKLKAFLSKKIKKSEKQKQQKAMSMKTKENETESAQCSEAESFAATFHCFWNRFWACCHGAYHETTTIPAMCYTYHSHPSVHTIETLQIISAKVTSITEDLRWPLEVFGIVAARDMLDRKLNIIFHRERDNCQMITEQDPYLALTGPSRAVVVSVDPSYIQVVLKVKGTIESEDKDLSNLAFRYLITSSINGLYPSKLSTLELRFHLMVRSVEATIHVKVTGGS